MQVRVLPVQVCVVLVQTMHVCANICLLQFFVPSRGWAFFCKYTQVFGNTHKCVQKHVQECVFSSHLATSSTCKWKYMSLKTCKCFFVQANDCSNVCTGVPSRGYAFCACIVCARVCKYILCGPFREGGGGGVNTCLDGLGLFFVHVQMDNVLF